jgi:carbonic anhydrase/acetyltransferase-like protein (isoleucine patch superfamily)
MFAIKLAVTGAASFAGALLVGVVAMTGRQVKRSGEDVTRLEATIDSLRLAVAHSMPAKGFAQGRPNVETDFNEDVDVPAIDGSAFVDPLASVMGAVRLGKQVYVAPFASIRGDEGQPIQIGDGANVQDGVVIHALETVAEGKPVPNRTVNVGGRDYAVYIGKRVSLAHQALVHGPARIDDDVFVGMQAMVFKAQIGEGVVIEPGARVIGVTVPPHRYVAAGQTVTDQKVADQLPEITDGYPFRSLNADVVHVNTSFAGRYAEQAKEAEAALLAKSEPAPVAQASTDKGKKQESGAKKEEGASKEKKESKPKKGESKEP